MADLVTAELSGAACEGDAAFERLREMGVQLSIDDFGTGYSSFNYLHRFPFDMLKIDRSFIQNLGESDQRLEIVRTIITLAHNLGLQVVAEGSESLETLRELEGLPCEFAQGFSIATPQSAPVLTATLDAEERRE